MRITLVFVFCLFVSTIQAESLESYLIKNYKYQKLNLLNDHKKFHAPYLIGKVNNSKAYIIFDTGSNGISIFNNSIKQLKLKKNNSINYSANMAGQTSINHSVIISKIKVSNDITLSNVKAGITRQPQKSKYPVIVIGTNFLKKYNAIFDFSDSSIYLNTKQVAPKQHYLIGQRLQTKDYSLINLTKLISLHQIMSLAINKNSPINCLVDTGTSDFTISDEYSKKIGLKSTSKKTISATDGTLTISNTNVTDLTINPLNIFYQKRIQIHNLKVTTANIEALSKFLGVVCIFGFRELKDTKSIYDFSAARLYVKN